ncbi:MAG: penicillin acylase family protein [Actinomycetota bacterium]|nr:penicillin acylase family protein [Actinomycetota bacterium]
MPSRRTALLAVSSAVLGLLVPVALADRAPKSRYDVTVRTTAYGIPHIVAKDWGSLGYGYGYSLAGDAICVMADTYTTVRAQRSKHFGAANGYVFRGNGAAVNNLNSDFFFKQIIDTRVVEKLMADKGPNGPNPKLFQGVTGYVAGYNRYLHDIGGAKGVKDPACKGKAWVSPITEMDVFRRFYQLALLASAGVAIDGIGGAQPPTPSAPVPVIDAKALASRLKTEFEGTLAIGSNAVALGSGATANGHGLLLGNPHFPWVGSERFFQSHLTIPGEMDVAGGSLLGVPLINIGHTAHMAWSHTVSTAYRFTPFQETLVPGDPTSYLYDGVPTKMTSRTVTVEDRPGHKASRTLWSTRHGSVFTSLLGLPLPWTPTTAFVMGDANAPNFRYLNHFYDVNHAQSSRQVLSILKKDQGIPWVNTIASDDKGEALYADISVTPHVTNSQVQTCATPVGQATFAALRLPVLDGSRSSCEWGSDPDSIQKGTFGPSKMPSLIRRDYVTNSNDSYWLANPAQPLTGFATIIGDEGTERTTRTRSGLVMVQEVLRNNGKFTRQRLQDLLFSDRQHSWELTKPDVLAMCGRFPGGFAPSSNGPVDVSKACATLGKWNGRDSLDARGALVFRRFWSRVTAVNAPVLGALQRTPIWATPFSAADPVHTPRGLNTLNPFVLRAFGDAVRDLEGAKIPVDGMLGLFQRDVRPDGTSVPFHGGPGTLGVFNALNVTWDATKGYAGQLAHGSSYIQVVQFDGDGCPDARTLLTYSQSPDPTNAHYSDQTKLFSRSQWVTDRFCARDVANATLSTRHLRG